MWVLHGIVWHRRWLTNKNLATSGDISQMPAGRVSEFSISAVAACYFIFEQGEAVRFNDVITQTQHRVQGPLTWLERRALDSLFPWLSLSLSLACSYRFNKASI